MRTAFHVTSGDPDEQARALRSVSNSLSDDTLEERTVAVVAHRAAVRMLARGSPNDARVETLAREGVGFKACSNSVANAGIDPSHLFDPVDVVPSGVGELARLQADGYVRL